jgi:hypothetical protein
MMQLLETSSYQLDGLKSIFIHEYINMSHYSQ